MFSDLPAPLPSRHRRVRHAVAWTATVVLSAGFLQATASPVRADPGGNRPNVQSQGTTAPARPAPKVRPRKPDAAQASALKAAPKVRWPDRAAVDIAVSVGTATRSAVATPPAAATVGGLAVSIAATTDGRTSAASGSRSAAGSAAATAAAQPSAAPAKVRVETLDRETAAKAGVTGPLLRVGRSDGGTGTATVRLTMRYRDFAAAYGGDFGARLRLVRLPECALNTPQLAACAPQPIPSVNSAQAGTLAADVPAGASRTLLAAVAAESSAQGNYAATPLAASSKWNVAPSSGAFTWSYPLRLPPVPGGESPGITLGYNSQTVDGRTTATNNQGSWLGEGFSYEPGYVERRYKPCQDDGHKEVGDLCWSHDNAMLVLNGRSSELVRDGTTWRFTSDDGSKIERSTGATNGDNDGESWKVTTVDGTQYFFGLNRLPGWAATREETASTWTVPVYGDDAGEPCHKAAFADAHCQQAWRWSLDYVKDPHGNVSSYFYERETNHYARGRKTDVNGTAYHRGGFLKRIDYGQRDNAVYTTNAPARVVFDPAERCLPTATVDCKPGSLTAATALSWPDVPFDRNCAAATKCKADQVSPTFWTRKRVAAITTQIRSGAGWKPVDSWSLEHLFTNNADGSRTLWLHKIIHKGHVGTGDPVAMPAVQLDALQLANRIDIPNDNVSPLIRPRISTVYTDSGAQIDVNYAPVDCVAGSLPTPGRSTKRCFPVKWHPTGETKPVTDWFHKHVVEAVIETDRTGGAPDMVTRYRYLGDAAWRHAKPDGIGDPDYLTWSEWRGYEKVRVTKGDGQTMTTRTEHTYLRGMHGDKDPAGGTREVTRTDSVGVQYTDHDELAGFEIETATYNGDDVVTKTTTKPWRHETASQKYSWGTDHAFFILPETSRSFTALETGGWRETMTTTSYDATTGRVTQVEDLGDVATATDDRCVRNSYADNPTAWLRNLVSRVETVAVKCDATPNRATQVISDNRTWYDGLAFGAVPTKGNVTKSEKLASHNGTTATYVTVAEGTFDNYGRPRTATDGAGTVTKIDYFDVDGLAAKTVQTGPTGFTTTTEFAPAWGVPTAEIDWNERRTDFEYDKLGRLAKVWLHTSSKAGNFPPNYKHTYKIEANAVVSVKTEKVKNSGTYAVEYKLYDGFLRLRQIQTEGPEGGRLVADTFYTPTGQVAKTNDTYFAKGAPADQILPVNNGDVDGQTAFVYDGADRITNTITLRSGDERWRTLTRYGGDRTHVDPPTGAIPTTTISDVRGQTTELWQYKGAGPTGDHDTTRYTYTPAGQQASVTDPAGNVWKYGYDQRGRKVRAEDPDAGTSTFGYDNLDRLTTTTDARNVTLTNTYDAMGRKTATFQGTAETGTKLASWAYDTIAKGQPYSSTRHVNGQAYTIYNLQLDSLYRPVRTRYVVPADAGEQLKGTYDFTRSYNHDGTVQGFSFPQSGGLPAESVVYGYNDQQQITKITGTQTTYATELKYGQTGELLQAELSTGGRKAWATYAYEQGTKRLKRSMLTRQAIVGPGEPTDTPPVSDVDQHFEYDAAGNVLSIADTPGIGKRDIQCFEYDYLRRMTEAWTTDNAAADPCAGGAAATGVAGPAPYHHSYTYDQTGNRLTEKIHAANGGEGVERTYSYPKAGAAHPHRLDSVTEKTAAGDRLYSYGYDAVGNTTKRTRVGEDQDLVWDAEGHLTSVTEAGKTTSFVYTADGDRLVRKEPTATTVYFPGMELRLDLGSKVVDGTRFYPVADKVSVVRTVRGTQFQAADHHGTGQAAVDASSGAIVLRRSTPFGGERGTQPGAGQWAGEKGFVGGTLDSTTGLTHLGAREYDAALGRFISVDPLIDVKDPQQMHGYAYSNNSPTTFSDADGLMLIADGGGGGSACTGSCATYVQYYTDLYNQQNGGGSGSSSGGNGNGNGGGGNGGGGGNPQASQARQDADKAKQRVVAAAKVLGKILMDELGVTDALDCFTSGDLGACAETVMNVAETFIGGLVAKLARKYAVPWKWEKAAALGKRLWDLGGEMFDAAKSWWKNSKLADSLGMAGGCNSFVPGTLVLLADGSRKRIEDVDVGDVVLATDPESRQTAAKTVVATIIGKGKKKLVKITIDTDGRAGKATGVLVATAGHPFWVPKLGKWLDATDLRPGQWLRSSSGTWVQVTAVERWTEKARVHNLTVDDIHTYHVVAGNTPVLVHNTNASCPVHGGPTGIPNRDLREPQDCTCDRLGRISLQEEDQINEAAHEIKERRTRAEAPARAGEKIVKGVDGADPVSAGALGVAAIGTWVLRKLRG